MNMKIAKIISVLGVLAMTVVLFYGFTAGDFGKDGAALLQNPWGIVSMVDLYTGFHPLLRVDRLPREVHLRSIIWVVLMMVLGFFAGSLYTFLALNASKGDWKKFWMGRMLNG
jgi:hypothetical protein